MTSRFEKRDWNDPLLTGRNRVLAHAPMGAYPHRAGACAGDRDATPWALSLNGVWKFALTCSPDDMPEGFGDPQHDLSSWHDMPVPSNWQLDPAVDDRPIYTNMHYPFRKNPPDPPEINPTGWYRTPFDLPEAWSGREIFLFFESCDSACKVWINGVEAGYSQDSKLPHEFNITPLVHPGRNHVAVMVPRYCDGFFLECQDYWHLSGIQRDVMLYSKPRAHIRDFVVRTTFDSDYADAELFVALYMNAAADIADGYRGEIMLYDDAGRAVMDGPVTAPVALESPMYRNALLEFTAAQFRIRIKTPRQWTPETPHLYTLTLTLIHPSGTAVDFERCRVGFRQVEICNRLLLLNGKRLIVRGVDAHEHHPEKGRALSIQDMRDEIIAMKRLNLNAIRTSHYPRHSAFYDLCDTLGMAVVDEANLETHGVQAMLSKDPLWMNAYMERAQRMALRDKNHPCVLIWSLGNESYFGPHHAAMAAWLRHYDPTRPVQYEGGFAGPAISDIACPMYPKLDWVRDVLADRTEPRPMVLCEYAYMKGNAGGNFKDYWDLVDAHPSFQGGFIWDWREKALVKTVNGRREWAYGGEFDGGIGPDDFHYGKFENPQQCLNGIVFADLTPKPAALEIMQVQGPVQTFVAEGQEVGKGQFTVWNKYIALDLTHLELRWSLTEDGIVIREGVVPAPAAAPGAKVPVDLALAPLIPAPGADYFLNVDLAQTAATAWSAPGHIIGWNQFALPAAAGRRPVQRIADMPELTLSEHDDGLFLSGPRFTASFSRKTGTLTAYVFAGRKLVIQGPEDLFYRARTDNDYITGNSGNYHAEWLDWGLNRLVRRVIGCEAVRMGAAVALVRIQVELAAPGTGDPAIRCETLYDVHATGDIVVRSTTVIAPPVAHVPRVGMEMRIAGAFNRLTWFGRGPHENYVDRKHSARVGLYSGSVDEQYVPFIDPCECGGKEDVRWLSLTADDGAGLLVRAMPLLHVNAQHFAVADLVKAGHGYELTRLDDIVLHLDHRHMGLGGDDGWTRNVHEPFMIRPGRYAYAFRLRGLHSGDSARAIAGTGIEGLAE